MRLRVLQDSASVHKPELEQRRQLPLSPSSPRGPITISVLQERGRELSDGLPATEQQRQLPWPPFKGFSLEARAAADDLRAVTGKQLVQQAWVDTRS